MNKHHFNLLSFLLLSGAVTVDIAGGAAAAAPGTNPFVNPEVDLALFRGALSAFQASQAPAPPAAAIV